MDATAYLAERSARVDRALDDRLPPAAEPPADLHAAMRHLVFPGGKRIRPGFAMAAAEAVGAPSDAALPAAVAVELIHTYTLVHDDLPCMDDDATRRGQPTVHVRYGEATAVLAGDALQALAFEVAAEADDPVRGAAWVALLARAAGSRALVGGQADDLACAGGTPDAEAIASIHSRKTAALLAAAVRGGALLGGAMPEQLVALGEFGTRAGLVYQIADDLLDADRAEPCTLVAALGAEAAAAQAEQLLDGALGVLEDWGERAEPLRELARFGLRRKQ